jgi:MFS family permease
MSVQQQIEQNLRHNYIVNFLDGAAFWLGASFFATRTILPLFISQLTDSTLAIGFLSAVISTGPLIPQLFTANWVQRIPVKKDIPVKIGLFLERLPIISLVLAAWLATWSKAAALYFGLFCITWFHFGLGVISVGWQDMMAKLFPTRSRGRFMGVTYFVGTAMGVVGAAGAAWVLETYPFPTNFMISFALAGLFISRSWVFLSLTKEPPDPPRTTTSNKSVDWSGIGEVFKQDINFRRYILSSIIATTGTMAIGFLTVYALDAWQVSNSQVGLFTTYMLCGQAIGYLVFGWLADRYGHKLVLEISYLLGAVSLVIAILARSPQVFYAVFAIQGVFAAATMLSGINIVFEFSNADVRPTYIGLANTVIGIFSGLAPMVGGLLVEGINYTWMFGIAAGLSFLGFTALRYWVIEPRNHNGNSDLIKTD